MRERVVEETRPKEAERVEAEAQNCEGYSAQSLFELYSSVQVAGRLAAMPPLAVV